MQAEEWAQRTIENHREENFEYKSEDVIGAWVKLKKKCKIIRMCTLYNKLEG